MKRFKDILCVVNSGKQCKPALERAATLAENNQANLTVVDVVERVPASIEMSQGASIPADLQTAMMSARGSIMRTPNEKITAYVEQVRRQHAANMDPLMAEGALNLGQETLDYLQPITYLVKGVAHKEIPALAKRIEADLIVMGTVGRTGISGFLVGHTAETVLNQIDCSMLAIKPPGITTPVKVEG